MGETRRYETTTKSFGLSLTGTGKNRTDGPQDDHALTIKLDHSSGADHTSAVTKPL